jgi:hypothetical protein
MVVEASPTLQIDYFPFGLLGLKARPKCLLSVKVATTNIGELENVWEG